MKIDPCYQAFKTMILHHAQVLGIQAPKLLNCLHVNKKEQAKGKKIREQAHLNVPDIYMWRSSETGELYCD